MTLRRCSARLRSLEHRLRARAPAAPQIHLIIIERDGTAAPAWWREQQRQLAGSGIRFCEWPPADAEERLCANEPAVSATNDQ